MYSSGGGGRVESISAKTSSDSSGETEIQSEELGQMRSVPASRSGAISPSAQPGATHDAIARLAANNRFNVVPVFRAAGRNIAVLRQKQCREAKHSQDAEESNLPMQSVCTMPVSGTAVNGFSFPAARVVREDPPEHTSVRVKAGCDGNSEKKEGSTEVLPSS